MTIMMNYIALGLLAYLLTTPAFQRPGRTDPISPIVDWNATMPRLKAANCTWVFCSPCSLPSGFGGCWTARLPASRSALWARIPTLRRQLE